MAWTDVVSRTDHWPAIGLNAGLGDRRRWLVIAVYGVRNTSPGLASVSVNGAPATLLAESNVGIRHLSFWKVPLPGSSLVDVVPEWSGSMWQASYAIAPYNGEPTLVDSSFDGAAIWNTDGAGLSSTTVVASAGNHLLSFYGWTSGGGGSVTWSDSRTADVTNWTGSIGAEAVSDANLPGGSVTVATTLVPVGNNKHLGTIAFSVDDNTALYSYGHIGDRNVPTLETSMPITLPAGSTVGDLIVVFAFGQLDGYTPVTATPTIGAGWTEEFQPSLNYGHRAGFVYSKVLDGTGDVPTFTWSRGIAATWVAMRFAGGGTLHVSQDVVFSGAATTSDPPALNCGTVAERIWTSVNCGLLTAVTQADYRDWGRSKVNTWPTGYVDNRNSVQHEPGRFDHPEISFAQKTATAQTDDPDTFARSENRALWSFTFAVDVAGGPPPPTPTGHLKVWLGSSWELKPLKVWDGSSWVTKPVKRWDGSQWITVH